MKKIILAACLLAAASSTVCYGQKKGSQAKAQRSVAQIDSVVGLNPEQKAKVLEFFSKPKDERGKIDESMKAVLTSEQYKKYEAFRAANRKGGDSEKKGGDKKGGEKKGGNKKGSKSEE